MLKTVLKFVVLGAVLYGGYKAAEVYALFKFADHMHVCLPPTNACGLATSGAPQDQVREAVLQAMSCARERRSVFESIVMPMPAADANEPANPEAMKKIACGDWGR